MVHCPVLGLAAPAAVVSPMVMSEVVVMLPKRGHQASAGDHQRKAYEGLLLLTTMYRRGDFITPQTNKQKPHAGGGEAPSLNPFLGACHTEAQLSLSLQGRWGPASRGCWGCLLNGCVLRPCSL